MVVMVVEHGTETVALESTAQASAVTDAALLRVMPEPAVLRAMMQPGALAFSSAKAVPLTGKVADEPITWERIRLSLVATTTLTAWLPSPDGDVTRLPVTSAEGMPLSDATLAITEFIVVVDAVAL